MLKDSFTVVASADGEVWVERCCPISGIDGVIDGDTASKAMVVKELFPEMLSWRAHLVEDLAVVGPVYL